MAKSLISIRDFSKEEILHVLETAKEFEQNRVQNFLEGKVIASLFFEPSTRTRLSFETAINRLGAKVIGFSDASNTSQSKGETLKDTIKMVNNYVDMIVMRHPLEGSSRYASEVATVPVVNAGDGANQHPSQTLLDLYSILQTQGKLEGLTINMVGDLKYGRTTHSLLQAMSHFNPRFIFTAPKELEMPREYKDFLDSKGIENIQYFTSDKMGHTWMNARHFLSQTFPLLFDKEASAKAMKEAQAAKPKTARKTAEPAAPAAKPDQQRLTPEVMARLFPKGIISPDYNNDGSVTFRLRAPQADKVELECQMFEGTRTMTKDNEGVWSINVTPHEPDIYPYAFIVDGTKIADPENMHIFPNEGFKSSLADVKGPQPDWQDLQDVPHGKISYTYYTSKAVGFDRPVLVYTPAGYDPASSEKYPVLYLIHGMTDTYETWFKVGKINNILDNLIAAGLAKKMIVVMPYANPYPEMIRRGQAKMYNPMDTELTTKEFTESVVPFIEANYNVLTDADSRAIAGFSLGGRQTLACGLGNPDKFHYVCAFAPAVFGPEISGNFENGTYAKADELNQSLKLLWLSCGTSDFLYQSSLQLENNLKDRGIRYTTMYPGGGHTWMNCRDYITEVCKLLFQ